MEEDLILWKLEILQLIENAYGIKIGDEEVEKIVTLKDLTALVRQKTKL